MGWFWQSGPNPSSNLTNPLRTDGERRDVTQPPSQDPIETTPNNTAAQARSKTRDEQAQEDFLAFLQSIEESYKKPCSSISAPADTSAEEASYYDPSAPELITPAHLYPSRSSCTILFDTAFHCASPYGQFLNVYRYGTFRQCGALWNDVAWCLRTNRGWMSVEERTERTLKKSWERERARLMERGGTSEEVWDRRRWIVKDPFSEGWNRDLAQQQQQQQMETAEGQEAADGR